MCVAVQCNENCIDSDDIIPKIAPEQCSATQTAMHSGDNIPNFCSGAVHCTALQRTLQLLGMNSNRALKKALKKALKTALKRAIRRALSFGGEETAVAVRLIFGQNPLIFYQSISVLKIRNCLPTCSSYSYQLHVCFGMKTSNFFDKNLK